MGDPMQGFLRQQNRKAKQVNHNTNLGDETQAYLRLQNRLVEQGLPPVGFVGGPYVPSGKLVPEPPLGSIEGLVQEPEAINFIRLGSSPDSYSIERKDLFSPFESACVHGPVSKVQSMMALEDMAPISLHRGLCYAIDVGNLDVVDYLLANGARLSKSTGWRVLKAPADRQIALFELFMARTRWTPNTRDQNYHVLLPDLVTNLPLLRWFLANGANPNFGLRYSSPGFACGPIIDSAEALQAAAGQGPFEAVQMLLDAGAQIKNGTPLLSAAAAEFEPGMDHDRIPIMALLVSRGADVNQLMDTPYLAHNYPLACAVEAMASQRAKWLLDHGANPYLKGKIGSAVEAAAWRAKAALPGGEEMKRIIDKGIRAQKWIQNASQKSSEA